MRLDCVGLDFSAESYVNIGRCYISLDGGISLFDWAFGVPIVRVRASGGHIWLQLGPLWADVYWEFRSDEELDAWREDQVTRGRVRE